MQALDRGRLTARLADTTDDLRAAQRLRWRCFVARTGAADDGTRLDSDDLDRRCLHMLIEDHTTGHLVCCYRILRLDSGQDIGRSYSARFYDLAALESYPEPMLEVGRFCVDPDVRDPDIIRIAWAALSRLVTETGAAMLFGCSSFAGTEPAAHAEAFAMLRARHLAPRRWWPRIKAPDVVHFACSPLPVPPDPRRAMAAMPPLLRSYLTLGGWVSDHAVVDPALRTMHVFTGVEIGSIPATRQRLLRRTAETI